MFLPLKGIEFNPKDFAGQAGVVFSPKDIVETAGVIYKFGKPFAKKDIFKILGGFEIKAKKFMAGEEVKMIGQLPSKKRFSASWLSCLPCQLRNYSS